VNLYGSHPFRILGLRSDASAREIARVSDRLLKWIEIGEAPQVVEPLPFLPAINRDGENIKLAVGQIENPRDRIVQELFWPVASNFHFQTCSEYLAQGRYDEFIGLCERAVAKIDVHDGKGKPVSASERLDASLCRHFLAIFFHSAAISSSGVGTISVNGARPTADWHRAFQCWTSVCRDDMFWDHIARRVSSLNDPRLAGFDVNQLRKELPQRLLEVNAQIGLAGLEGYKHPEFVANARLIRKSPFNQSEQERALKRLTDPLAAQFQKALSEIAPLLSESAARERTSGLRQLPTGGFEGTIDPAKFHEYLSFVKGYLDRKVVPIGELIQEAKLDGTEAGRELLDTLAYTLRRFSLAINNVGDTPKIALEITRKAKGFAKSGDCVQRLLEDEKALQFIILQREAINATESKRYDEAILKLQEARKYASPEEEKSVDDWIEATKKRAVLGDTKPISSAPTMSTINGIGTTLYGRRAFDKSTQTYIATLFFVVLFIPVFPIAAYRVRNAGGNQYQFFGKVPLTKWAFLPSALIAVLILFMLISNSLDSSTSSYSGASSPKPVPTAVGATEPTTSQNSPATSSGKSQLSAWLDREESRLKNEESQINEMKTDIERERARLRHESNLFGDAPSQEEVDNYKAMEGRFNASVSDFNGLLERHHISVQRFNSEIERYNSMH
jgi:tetratricopeptide (TPR) repeat protein